MMNSPLRRRYYKKKSAADYAEDAYLTNPIASATECTGLTPTVPEDGDEAASYCDIAEVPVTARDGEEETPWNLPPKSV